MEASVLIAEVWGSQTDFCYFWGLDLA